MFKLFNGKKAQSTAEYAIVIALVIGVIAAMQIYVKRGVQQRLKIQSDFLSSDKVDEGYELTTIKRAGATPTKQYEPYYINSSYIVTSDSQRTTGVNTGVWKSEISQANPEKITRVGKDEVAGGAAEAQQRYEAPNVVK